MKLTLFQSENLIQINELINMTENHFHSVVLCLHYSGLNWNLEMLVSEEMVEPQNSKPVLIACPIS